MKIGNNEYACRSCDQVAFRLPCECVKSVEFDRTHCTLRVEHQGTHRCHAKANVSERRKVLDQLPIPMSGSTKAKKYITDCFRYNIENGNIKEAFNLCDAVSEMDVVDRMKKMCNYANKSVNCKDLIESFGHKAHIQDSVIKADEDKYLI